MIANFKLASENSDLSTKYSDIFLPEIIKKMEEICFS